jgi:hypothetical protein
MEKLRISIDIRYRTRQTRNPQILNLHKASPLMVCVVHCPFDNALQFADISGPRIRLAHVKSSRRYLIDLQTLPLSNSAHTQHYQRRDIFTPIT